jgi:hypothetical protein
MAFDANRDIRIEASEGAPGSYTLRTRGLADRRRPELEIAGVPEAGLNAAAGVINIVADYTVNKAEVTADQSVGNVLTVGEEGRKLLLAVRAVLSEKPKAGLWSKIAGGGKGVLRLVDVDAKEGETGAPRTALATMLVHRAAVRLAKDDDEGALTELTTAIDVFPGEAGAGAAPSIGGAEGEFNWQNHVAYLDRATLAGRAGEVDEAAAFFGSALARSEELARREIGATLASLASLDDAVLEREAKKIIDHNLAAIHRTPGPTSALLTLGSPIWEVVEAEGATRRACLMPAALVALYYEGAAAEGLRRSGPALVTKILGATREEPWRAAWIARETRHAWVSGDAPLVETIGPADPAQGIVSSVLADVARCFRAGASEEEILTRYAPRDEAQATLRDSLEEKLGRLAIWEGEQYLNAMAV